MDPTDPNFGGLLSGLFGMGATPSLPPGVNPIANANITQAAMQTMPNPDGTMPDAGSQYATGTPAGAVTLPPPRPAGIGDAPNLPTMANGGTGPDLPTTTAAAQAGAASDGINWSKFAKALSDPSFAKSFGGMAGTGAAKSPSMQVASAPMVQPPQRQAAPFSMAGLSQYMPGRRQGATL